MTDKIDSFVTVPLYVCDPNKNNDCPKDVCHRNGGQCKHTFNKNCARTGTIPKPTRIHKDIWAAISKEETK